MLDLSKQPVVESHCHAFLPDKETKPFEQYLTLSEGPVPKIDMVSTLLYRHVVCELSRVLEIDGRHEEILEERHKRYKRDPVGYIRLLFEDANIETLLVDTGYPGKLFSGYSIDLKDFSEIVPCRVREIFRIDTVIYDLLENQLPFDDAVEHLHGRIKRVFKGGAVSLKSVVAYRTGLEIRRNGEEVVRKAHDELLAEVGSGRSIRDILTGRSKQIKTVYDYLVFLGVEDSVSLNVPFQIHVGMGDTPSIDLRISNPILLRELINDGSSREARIVLTHWGYPYVEEAGFLVSTYPNVFLDLSETMPFTGVGIKEKLRGLLSIAPATKLMYGSDGFNIPELHWFSSIQTKRVLSAVLNEMLGSGEMEEEWAYEAARQFLRENARRVYKL